MINKSTRFAIITSIMLSGGIHFFGSLSYSQPQFHQITITIPQASMNFHDLDVRDSQNQRVASEAAKAKLRSLFVTRLNVMLIHNITPQKTIITNWFKSKWDTASGWLRRNVLTPIFDSVGWIKTKKIFKGWVSFSSVGSVVEGESISIQHRRTARNSFLYLVSSLISSTVLLR